MQGHLEPLGDSDPDTEGRCIGSTDGGGRAPSRQASSAGTRLCQARTSAPGTSLCVTSVTRAGDEYPRGPHKSRSWSQGSQNKAVQFSSVAQSCPTLCGPIDCSTSLPKLMSIESVMPSNHLILCRPLLLLPSIFPSIRVFSNELALCIRWPKLDYDLEQQRQGKSGSRITSPFWSLDDDNKWTECASDVSHQRRSRVSTLPQVHLPRGWPATWAWL